MLAEDLVLLEWSEDHEMYNSVWVLINLKNKENRYEHKYNQNIPA